MNDDILIIQLVFYIFIYPICIPNTCKSNIIKYYIFMEIKNISKTNNNSTTVSRKKKKKYIRFLNLAPCVI